MPLIVAAGGSFDPRTEAVRLTTGLRSLPMTYNIWWVTDWIL
jgi:hypothetical protein